MIGYLLLIITQIHGFAVDPCQLPAKVGNCRALIPRWFFNSQSGRCELFHYGGCGGNSNNFHSLEACQAQCHADGLFNNDVLDVIMKTGDTTCQNVILPFNTKTNLCDLAIQRLNQSWMSLEFIQICNKTCTYCSFSVKLSYLKPQFYVFPSIQFNFLDTFTAQFWERSFNAFLILQIASSFQTSSK